MKQLTIHFPGKQLATLDAIAIETSSNRSAVVKAYASGYSEGGRDVDEFGDLNEFHRSAAADRAAADSGETWP